MAKAQKTASELKELIFERIGIKVTVLPNKLHGWTATVFVSTPLTAADQFDLDRLVKGLRAEYDLKIEESK